MCVCESVFVGDRVCVGMQLCQILYVTIVLMVCGIKVILYIVSCVCVCVCGRIKSSAKTYLRFLLDTIYLFIGEAG